MVFFYNLLVWILLFGYINCSGGWENIIFLVVFLLIRKKKRVGIIYDGLFCVLVWLGYRF